MVILKTLVGSLAANVNEITFTDAIINSNSIIEVYYNNNDIYTVETWQRENTIGIVTSDHDFPVSVKVLINNVVAFEPYDDSELLSRLSSDEDDITALDGRLDTAEDDIDNLETRMGSAEDDIDALESGKQNVLIAGDNITIEGNVISASGGGSDDYSTLEQVIGTWIDGKPLYRIVLPEKTCGSGETNYTHNLGIKYYINYYGMCSVNNDNNIRSFPFYQHRWSGYIEINNFATNSITISASWSNNKATPVLIYTKTSDYE